MRVPPESSQSVPGGTPVIPLPVYRVMDAIPLKKLDIMRELARDPEKSPEFIIMAGAYSISAQQIDTLRAELLSDV